MTARNSMDRFFAAASLIGFIGSAGCGFQMRNIREERFTAWNISRIYVPPVVNQSYRVGLEAVLRNEWTKRLETSGVVHVVQNIEDADAILEPVLAAATRTGSAQSPTDQLAPIGQGKAGIAFHSMYTANVTTSTRLVRKNGPVLWEASVSRSQPFPSNTKLGYLGTTSALINATETDRAYQELIEQLVQDSYRRMTDTF